MDCVTFDLNSISHISKTVVFAINDQVKNYFIQENKILNYNWINILLSTIPTQLVDPSIKLIHDFYVLLSNDYYRHPSNMIDDMREGLIFEAISNTTELILKNKTQELLSHDVLDEESLVNFLSFPSNFIKKKITNRINKIFKDILTNEKTIQISHLFNDMNILENIESIKKYIIIEEKEKEDTAKKASEEEYQQAISSKFIYVKQCINQYNKMIDLLLRYQIRHEFVDEKVKFLLELQKNLQIYNEIFKEEGFHLKIIRYCTTKEEKVYIQRGNEKYLLGLPNTDQYRKFHYLLPHECLTTNHNTGFSCYDYDFVIFNYIKEEYDENHQKNEKYNSKIKQIVISHTTKSIDIPKLVFGERRHSSEEFISLLNRFLKYIREFDLKFLQPLEKNQFTMESFNFIESISSNINEILGCLKVRFSDDSETTKDITDNVTQIRDYLKDLLPLINELILLTRKDILPILKDVNQYKDDIKIFYDDFNIQIPKFNENPQWKPNFSSISKIESLSSPIISISQDKKLIKSVNKLKCSVGPIIPSHYTEPISINIISFINDEVSCEIQNISDPNFCNWISIKEKIKNFEPIQLFITPHSVSENEKFTKEINGNISIKTQTTEPLILPFQLSLGILPLQIRLTCREYKLVKEDSLFKLCIDKIESESKITFEVKNYYIHNSFIIAVDLESLDDNEIEKPKDSTDPEKQELYIKFPSVKYEPKKCKFCIKIAFSDNFVCKILCDVLIIPFNSVFEFYDYSEKTFKEFNDKSFSIIFNQGVSQTYFLRIQSMYPSKKHGKIEFDVPKSCSIEYDKSLSDSFEIGENRIIPIKFIRNTNKIEYGKVKLYIEDNLYKSISFSFNGLPYFPSSFSQKDSIKYNNEFISKYPCQSFQSTNKSWTEIKNNNSLIKLDDTKKPYIVVSPFNYFYNKNLHEIKYNNGSLYVFPSKDIEYTQFTITKKKMILGDNSIFNKKKEDFTEYTEKTIFSKPHYYFSIFGKISEFCWFPVFDKYPNVTEINILPLNEQYYNAAEFNIQQFKRDLILEENVNKIFITITECFYVKNPKELPVKRTNFVIFMAFLLDKNTISNLNSIISLMPKEIQNNFNDILTYLANNKKISDKIKLIISHNLVVTFAKIFIAKYKEIQSREFRIDLPLDVNEIKNKKMELFTEYFTFNEEKAQEKSKLFKTDINNNEELIKNDINAFKVPENAHNCFLIAKESANITITPSEPNSLGEYQFQSIKDDDDNLNNNMENLSLPPIKKTETYSIQNLCNFYSSCSQGAIILPTYIRYQYKKNNLDDAEIFFGKLLNIYNEVSKYNTSNKSIISSHINYFIESFKNCVKRLKKAGINIDSYYYADSSYDSKQNDKQEYIIYPPPHIPNLTTTQWKNKANPQDKDPKPSGPVHDPKFTQTRYTTKKTDLSQNNRNNLRERNTKKTKNIATKNKIDDKVIDTKIDQSGFNVGYNDSQNQSGSNRQIDSKRQKLKVDDDIKKLTQVTSESVDGLLSNFNEIDAINLMIKRIQKTDKTQSLTFFEKSDYSIPDGYLYPQDIYNTKVIPIKDLVDNCQYLIANLISKASETNCPFHDMYSNLLIDTSAFISIENKIYNFMLLTSFSYALSALEIPFSIAVVADQNFRFVLKSFDDNLSMFNLQKVFDCLFIKRFRTNIADTCNYSIENMKYPDQKKTQRSLFLFSNGIDENLVFAESWKEKILNDSNNSFGFIFTKSKQVVSESNSNIQGIWDEFNNVTKSSPSFAKIIYINSDINDSTTQIIASLFKDTLDRTKKTSEKDKLNISNDYKPEFIDEFETLQKDEFESIREDIKFDFDEDSSSFFRQCNPKFNDVPTKFEKLDDRFYRNKANKIVKTALEDSIRDDFYQFIHNIICANKFIFKPLLEFIFTPNLSTQKVLSRTGTEFDITALIFNLINPVPDPLIYLEQKGGLIRNYGISVVIDSSRSCFNPLSACHSYKTIEVLFSALSLIDVPCVDVIIATDNAPIVLCSEVPSMRLLNEKSQFWISLFKSLYNSSYDKCNLESAIHAAFDIRKMRYINPTSYMFVLTDGLYENEQKQLIKNHLLTCQHNGISIFGIGIGIYPRGIVDMFPNIIFATNPNYLIHGIASFFGNQTVESYNDSIKHLTPEPPKFEIFSSIIKQLSEFIEKPIFIDLKQHLAKTPHALGIKQNVSKLGANVTGVLRFSIQWNDIGDWDKNDLDAHCIEPSGFEIMFDKRINKETGGNLDVDIVDPKEKEPACENITWPDINRMKNGTYRFFVHQFSYRNGQSGFRAEIAFNGFSYFYDYNKPLSTNKENVYVADVTLQDGNFTINHKLDFY